MACVLRDMAQHGGFEHRCAITHVFPQDPPPEPESGRRVEGVGGGKDRKGETREGLCLKFTLEITNQALTRLVLWER